jgi:hypothetical protein
MRKTLVPRERFVMDEPPRSSGLSGHPGRSVGVSGLFPMTAVIAVGYPHMVYCVQVFSDIEIQERASGLGTVI